MRWTHWKILTIPIKRTIVDQLDKDSVEDVKMLLSL